MHVLRFCIERQTYEDQPLRLTLKFNKQNKKLISCIFENSYKRADNSTLYYLNNFVNNTLCIVGIDVSDHKYR